MSSDFRQIVHPSGPGPKADRLFRAAVSAFSSLTRPTRREVIQLEDLAEPIYPAIGSEAKRFAAAALSESRYAPAELIRRLAGEAVDVAAPLLIRSPVITDVDLIALIGRHGLPHARAIRRRPGLNPAIARLADMLAGAAERAAPSRAEPTIDRLRAMMRADPQAAGPELAPPAATPRVASDHRRSYARLLVTVFEPNAALFQTALADALEIGFPRARAIIAAPHYSELMLALRALDLPEEQAFLIAAARYPCDFAQRDAIRLFLDRYRQTGAAMALEKLLAWRSDEPEPAAERPHAVSDPDGSRRLKAS